MLWGEWLIEHRWEGGGEGEGEGKDGEGLALRRCVRCTLAFLRHRVGVVWPV